MVEQVTLQVRGMTCVGCEQRVDRVLRRLDGVRGVQADHTTGRVGVRIEPWLVDRSALVERAATAGFEVVAEEAPG